MQVGKLLRFIVTAYRWGEYLGRIDVAFEAEGGRILAYTGAPIIMTQNMTQDEELQSFIEEARVPFEAVRSPRLSIALLPSAFRLLPGHLLRPIGLSSCSTRRSKSERR